MLVRNFSKLLFLAILCIFVQANAMFSFEQKCILALLNQELSEQYSQIEGNVQVQNVIYQLYQFVDNLLAFETHDDCLSEPVSVAHMVNKYVERLFIMWQVDESNKHICGQIVARGLCRQICYPLTRANKTRSTYGLRQIEPVALSNSNKSNSSPDIIHE